MKAIDHFGNPCLGMLPPLKFELVSEFNDEGTHGQCEGSNSFYRVMFTPTVKGQNKLHVAINNQYVTGSPFTVHVKSSVENLGSPFSHIDGLTKPWGIAVNEKREIIVSESTKHCISVYSTRGEKIRSFGTQGSGEGQFESPRGLTLDDTGNIVVADYNNHRIQMFTEDGQFLKEVGTRGAGPLQFNGPNALTFNPQNKQFYVVDGDGSAQILSSRFYFCGRLEMRARNRPQRVSSEYYGISCDSNGQVYVVDTLGLKVQVFTAEGALVRDFSKFPSGSVKHGLSSIAIDANNFVYISSYLGNHVFVRTIEGETLKKFSTHGRPYGIAVDDYGTVYVCDDNKGHIYIH